MQLLIEILCVCALIKYLGVACAMCIVGGLMLVVFLIGPPSSKKTSK